MVQMKTTPRSSTLTPQPKRDMEERLAFIRFYVKRLRENPDGVFKEQVSLVNSFLQAAEDFPLTREEYLRLKGELGD